MKRLVWAGAAAAVGVFAWANLVERNRFTLREHTLPVLPAGQRPIRILHLSDLHMAPWQRGKQDWIAGLATLRPDFVIGTGDFLGHGRGIDGVARALAPFRGTPGAFVNGSNDYFAPHAKNPLKYLLGPSKTPPKPKKLNIDELEDLYRSLGWIDLNNRAEAVTINNTAVALVGVDDAHKGLDDLDDALIQLHSLGEVDTVIGVTHAPYRRVLDAFTATGTSVIFGGHTHGGQVCLPPALGGTIVTNCDIPRDQARGLSIWHLGAAASALNVSAGIGTSIYAPVRLFCPPEASLITLIPGE